MYGRSPEDGRSVAARVLAILYAFSPDHEDLSLRQIVARSGLPPTTAHRLIGELCAWGALERDANGLYRIGRRLRDVAKPA
jgi:DNA-binding IclR family transcriptional regulator